MAEPQDQRELVDAFGTGVTQLLAGGTSQGLVGLLADPGTADQVAEGLLAGAREIAESFDTELRAPSAAEIGFNSLAFTDLYGEEPAPPGVTEESFAGRWHLMWMADPEEDDHDYWVAAWVTVVSTAAGLRIGAVELEE